MHVYLRIMVTLIAAVLGAAAAACSSPSAQSLGPQQTVESPAAGPATPSAASASAPATGATRSTAPPAADLELLTEPQSGPGPIYQLISGARASVDLTMYELDDPTAEAGLAAAAARGVDVRVILDQHLEQSSNTPAYDYLTAHGVHVHWGPSATTYHQKTLTIDDATSAIMTLNLVSPDYPGTRDFAVIDRNGADVAAIVATFNADFAGRAINPTDGADLVWSPTNAESSVLSIINSAGHTLAVEDEEMSDPAVTDALAAAARRGIRVTITMTADSQWEQALAELAHAGVHIRLYANADGTLYIHAKAIVADVGLPGEQALIGSQNFSVASLDYNRELGVLTRSPGIVAGVSRILAADYAGATAYARAAPNPASSRSSGTWCTATASVYSSYGNENNVYVRSNQPYQQATASADGYSHSYETDDSGYALIYLNGPPPGALITVTVGGATCTARD